MKIKLNPHLYHQTDKGSESILSIQKKSGLTYPTYLSMVRGKWNTHALAVLAKFITSLGITSDQLKGKRFDEIFEVVDE